MTRKYYHNKRLLKLASFLMKIRDDRFDLSYFTRGGIPTLKKVSKEQTCNTAACAIGWCPVVFPKNAYYYQGNSTELNIVCKKTKLWNFEFARRFFGLSGHESSYLFMPDTYRKFSRGPKDVARRIRQFVKTGEIE